MKCCKESSENTTRATVESVVGGAVTGYGGRV